MFHCLNFLKFIDVYVLLLLALITLIGILLYYYNSPSISEGMSNKYCAVIVEPRKHKALSYVLKNAVENLDDNWEIIILHGNQNEQYVIDILDDKLKEDKHRIMMHNLNVDNLTIEEYNDLLTSKKFYDYVPYEYFLIFQTDSFICENFKQMIYDFIDYDYVGAPQEHWVGNGGLSLRKKSKMLEIVEKDKRKPNENEDLFFTKKEHNLNIPSKETAGKFSNEYIYTDESFGVHKPWAYFSEENFMKKCSKCKGLLDLKNLNKEET